MASKRGNLRGTALNFPKKKIANVKVFCLLFYKKVSEFDHLNLWWSNGTIYEELHWTFRKENYECKVLCELSFKKAKKTVLCLLSFKKVSQEK